MLKTQYRMLENICAVSSSIFYEGKLMCGKTVLDPDYTPKKIQTFLMENYEG